LKYGIGEAIAGWKGQRRLGARDVEEYRWNKEDDNGKWISVIDTFRRIQRSLLSQ
jgi:hypothetical protein